jgi:hypothetical protein
METELTLKELKELLIKKYRGKDNPYLDDDLTRELIITEVKNTYNGRGDITIFSVKGSPPKGEAILLMQSEDKWHGILYYMGRTFIRKLSDNIKIIKDVEEIKEEVCT